MQIYMIKKELIIIIFIPVGSVGNNLVLSDDYYILWVTKSMTIN